MRKQLLPLAALAISTLCVTPAVAGNKAETLSLTPFIGGLHFEPNPGFDPAIIGGARIGYNITRNIGIEGVAAAGNSTTSPPNVSIATYRLEGIYNFIPNKSLVPFVAVGYGGMNFKHKEIGQDVRAGLFSYGIGAKYFINDTYAIRGDARHLVMSNSGATENFAEYTLGLQMSLDTAAPALQPVEPPPLKAVAPPAPEVKPAPVPAPPPPPAPKQAPPVVKPAPAPAPAASININPSSVEVGKSVTLSWSAQNSTDCSIFPSIGPVQTSGSMIVTPVENTAYTLSCSGAGGSAQSSTTVVVRPKPVVVQVVDSDKDGVADPMDKCPDTPAGVKVDRNGCPPPPAASCKNFNLEIEFDTAKADIKPAFDKEIKQVADFLKENMGSTASIEGHTDNVGAADMNMKLSQRRADSVRNYLIKKFGIAADRITAKGFGLTKPRASNKTAKGRYENRRVEALMYCGE